MSLHGNKENENTGTNFSAARLTLLAMLLCCALIAGYIERSIPFDFAVPGVKLGLANIVVLFALYKMRHGEVFTIVILKCFLTSVFTSSFAAFAYSISGSLLSFSAMSIMLRTGKQLFSPIGVSVIGAVCHNLGQILAATVILGGFHVFTYLPVLLISGVITGVLVGAAVKALIRHVALDRMYQ